MEQAEIRKQWEDAAPGWARWEEKIAHLMEPATQSMLKMAGIVSGVRVLDLACGAGNQTLITARLVGQKGHVVACDISANMLRHVNHNAEEANLKNITTKLSAAEEINLPAASFDAVICRLGLMLFTDPSLVLRKVSDVLKPGGRLAVVVFTVPETNPFMAKPMQILLRHAGKKPPAPEQPGIFALGSPGVIENLFSNNGFGNIEKRTFSLSLKLASASEALVMIQEAFGAYRAVMEDSSEAVRTTAWAEVGKALKGFETITGFKAPIQVMVAAGSKNR